MILREIGLSAEIPQGGNDPKHRSKVFNKVAHLKTGQSGKEGWQRLALPLWLSSLKSHPNVKGTPKLAAAERD
jgi:hypothetical protein